jgi:hypothetical protein
LNLSVVSLKFLETPNLIAQLYLLACRGCRWPAFAEWAHLDSNQGPSGYEPPALTAELWAQPRFVHP